MMRFTWVIVGVLGLLWFGATRTATAQDGDKGRDFMRAKLIHSQKVLEGLVSEDYDAIAKNSQDMSLLSQASNWQVLQTPEYRDRSAEFRRSVDAITNAARKQNLEGATLAYVNATMNCVTCHKYVRENRTGK